MRVRHCFTGNIPTWRISARTLCLVCARYLPSYALFLCARWRFFGHAGRGFCCYGRLCWDGRLARLRWAPCMPAVPPSPTATRTHLPFRRFIPVGAPSEPVPPLVGLLSAVCVVITFTTFMVVCRAFFPPTFPAACGMTAGGSFACVVVAPPSPLYQRQLFQRSSVVQRVVRCAGVFIRFGLACVARRNDLRVGVFSPARTVRATLPHRP